ncbi:MAG: hypothetical protein WC197_05710 [Candidatus Gastranaerophilaceae bacterium]|jgi:hypothetical protein
MSIFNQITETPNCKNCEKIHKWQLEHMKHTVAEHQRYNTIICSIGYGSLITILNITKDNLNDYVKTFIILFLAISISIFVGLEMQNIGRLKDQIQRLITAIYEDSGLSNIKKIYNDFYNESQKQIKSFNFLRNISKISGFISAILLILNLIYFLIK